MNFLAPWFLLGALAIAGPVLFHLIRRAVKERTPFSSLMFLNPAPPRLTRRRQLEHIWLLILRCLCLMLLAFGFARPFLKKNAAAPPQPGEARDIMLLIDTSASMKRDGLWNKARAVAADYLKKATLSDRVAIVAFDRQPRTLMSFADWTAWPSDQRASLAEQRLSAVSPNWSGTQLGLALTSAAEQFFGIQSSSISQTRKEIVLISDMQEGARLDGLQGHEWPTGVRVISEQIDSPPLANAGLELQAVTTGAEDAYRVRVTNARDSTREKFLLRWDQGQPLEIYLAPGQTRTFSPPKLAPGATAARLVLTGDEADFDNQSFLAIPDPERVVIAWLGSESAADPQKMRYYAERVFPDRPNIEFTNVEATSLPLGRNFSFAVVTGPLSQEQAGATHAWIAEGRTAMMVLSEAKMGQTLSAVAGVAGVQVTETTGEFALLSQIDFSHPLFAPFADPRYSDFSHIHFWKHRRIQLPADAKARIVAAFDDGSPALMQIPVGKGDLLVLASGWNPADSQLAASSKFPPLMQRVLNWTRSSEPAKFQFYTGDQLTLTMAANSEVGWKKPDGKTLKLPANEPFTETDLPGIYVAKNGSKEWRFAVNLSLDESRTAPMPADTLARLGVPLGTKGVFSTRNSGQQEQLQAAALENNQKLWRWLILAALALTLGEFILSGLLARRLRNAEVSG